MEENTLEWISNTVFYVALFFINFIISNIIYKWRFKTIKVEEELTEKDNVAFSIMTTGYFISVLIIFIGVLKGDSYGYSIDAFLIITYGIIGNILLILSSLFNDKFVFRKVNLMKEIIIDENRGVGIVEAASYIGSSLIIYGAVTGKPLNLFPQLETLGMLGSGLISLMLFWIIGQVILYLALKLYASYSKYNFRKEIKRDNNAVGIVYASVLIAIAYLYSQAIEGDIAAWVLTFENIVYYLIVGFLILPLSRLFIDKVILPKTNLSYEMVEQKIPNQGVAFIEAFAYIGSAILISYCI